MNKELEAFYQLSPTLSLTEIRSSDGLSIVKHINDVEISRNTLHIPNPYYEKDALEFIELCREFEKRFEHVGQFAIRWEGEMIGGIGFLYSYGETSHIAEIGYWLGAEHRRKGIITAAIKKIVEIGFGQKGLFRIEANVFEANVGSMKALERANFQCEGLRKSRFIKDDKLIDAHIYAILKE